MQIRSFVSNITGVCSHDKLTANQGWGYKAAEPAETPGKYEYEYD